MISDNDENYFKRTELIITTLDLPETFAIPSFNIYDILDQDGSSRFWNLLHYELSNEHFQKMRQDFIRFFSEKGVAGRLTLLNPKVVINEVENVILKYENYYMIHLDGKIKLNLYMHIALMLERLILSSHNTEDDFINFPKNADEFVTISKSIFHPIGMKYNIHVSNYEISLLYELLKSFISKI